MITQTPFISAALDDINLEPIPFRVFCHICRRAGYAAGGTSKGVFYESYDNAANHVGISRSSWCAAIKKLLSLNMIQVASTPGRRNNITLINPVEWIRDKVAGHNQNFVASRDVNNVEGGDVNNVEAPPPNFTSPYKVTPNESVSKKEGEESPPIFENSSKDRSQDLPIDRSGEVRSQLSSEESSSFINPPVESAQLEKRSNIPPPRKKTKKIPEYRINQGGKPEAFKRPFLEWVKARFKLENLHQAAQHIIGREKPFQDARDYLESLWDEFSSKGNYSASITSDQAFDEAKRYALTQGREEVSAIAAKLLNRFGGWPRFQIALQTQNETILKAEFTTHFNQIMQEAVR